ncbi:MAG: hypothetical protein HY735_14600 [Verrucomicrobia bacterium]|nr:hypothetical protein [Verrucomicrobiota bacterium]
MADMIEVNTRKFVRDFAAMKELTKAGSSVRIVEGGLTWVFRLDKRKSGFLGATQGTLQHQGPPEELFATGEGWEAEK